MENFNLIIPTSGVDKQFNSENNLYCTLENIVPTNSNTNFTQYYQVQPNNDKEKFTEPELSLIEKQRIQKLFEEWGFAFLSEIFIGKLNIFI